MFGGGGLVRGRWKGNGARVRFLGSKPLMRQPHRSDDARGSPDCLGFAAVNTEKKGPLLKSNIMRVHADSF